MARVRRACVLATRRARIHFHFHTGLNSLSRWQLRSWLSSTQHGLERPLRDSATASPSNPASQKNSWFLPIRLVLLSACILPTAHTLLVSPAPLNLDPPLFYSRTVDKLQEYTSRRHLHPNTRLGITFPAVATRLSPIPCADSSGPGANTLSMPLMVMSPNLAERDSPSRKRSHEEYSESVSHVHIKAEPHVDIKTEPSEKGTYAPRV